MLRFLRPMLPQLNIEHVVPIAQTNLGIALYSLREFVSLLVCSES